MKYKEINKKVEIKMKLKRKHGNILEDFAKILECAKKEVRRFDIDKSTKLAKPYIIEYTDFLVSKNLLKTIPIKIKSKYKITEKGLRFLKHYYAIKKLLE